MDFFRWSAVLPLLAVLALAGALLGFVLPAAAGYVPAPRRALPRTVSPRQSALLLTAEQVLIRDCMARSGFRYWLVPPSPLQPFPDQLGDVPWARRYGFGSSLVFHAPDPNRSYLTSLPASQQQRYATALNGQGPFGPVVQVTLPGGGIEGESRNGCQAAAEKQLYGNLRQWFRADTVTSNLPPLWQPLIEASADYRRLLPAWARGLRARRLDLASPAAASSAYLRPSPPGGYQQEARVAVASARCADRTGLAATAARLAAFYSRRFDHEYREEVTADRQLAWRAIPLAERIVRSES
jgi:hypothetical protein